MTSGSREWQRGTLLPEGAVSVQEGGCLECPGEQSSDLRLGGVEGKGWRDIRRTGNKAMLEDTCPRFQEERVMCSGCYLGLSFQ